MLSVLPFFWSASAFHNAPYPRLRLFYNECRAAALQQRVGQLEEQQVAAAEASGQLLAAKEEEFQLLQVLLWDALMVLAGDGRVGMI